MDMEEELKKLVKKEFTGRRKMEGSEFETGDEHDAYEDGRTVGWDDALMMINKKFKLGLILEREENEEE